MRLIPWNPFRATCPLRVPSTEHRGPATPSAERRVPSTEQRTAAAALLLLAAAVAVTAQERQTFRTSTRLVEVSVVVTTGDGRPVRGLTQADFTLKEDGRVQPVSFLDVRDGSALPGRDDESPFVVPDAPGTFTNVARAPAGTSTVLLLDRTNAAFDSQWHAQRHIDRFLAGMSAGDRTALYVLDGAIRVLHDFTNDARSLRQALETYHARVTGDYAASNEPVPDTGGAAPWLSDPADTVPKYFLARRAVLTLEVLELLANHLAGISGRKNLVWVSEAFTIPVGLDRLEVLEKLRRAHRALSHAQVSVYPVDSRGLVGAYSVVGRQIIFNSLARVRGNIETMEIIAEETGGRVFANTNALDRSIGRAVEDSRTSYVLGYYPPSAAADGRFRRIEVEVNRPRVHVRHRAGYFAAPPALREKDTSGTAIRNALEGPLQTTGVGLAARARRSGDEITLALTIDPSTISLERNDDRWQAAVDVLIAQVDRAGRGLVDVTVPLAVSLTGDERSRALTEGITMERRIAQKSGTTELRVVARDVATGKVGSLVIPAARVK